MHLNVLTNRGLGAGANFQVFDDEAARRGGLGHGMLLVKDRRILFQVAFTRLANLLRNLATLGATTYWQ